MISTISSSQILTLTVDSPWRRPLIWAGFGLAVYTALGRWMDPRILQTPIWGGVIALFVFMASILWRKTGASSFRVKSQFKYIVAISLLIGFHTFIFHERVYGFDKGVSAILFISLPAILLLGLPKDDLTEVLCGFILGVFTIGSGLAAISLRTASFSLAGLRSTSDLGGPVMGGGPITISRWIGMALMITVSITTTAWVKYVKWLVVFMLAWAMLLHQSRAPMGWLFIVLLSMYSIKNWKIITNYIKLHFIVFICIFGAMLILVSLVIYSYWEMIQLVLELTRFYELGLSDRSSSAMTRWRYWVRSFEFAMEYPLTGVGVGGWPIHFEGLDYRYYPHNMLMEVVSEFGFTGLLLFLGWFRSVCQGMILKMKDPVSFLLIILFLYSFANAMFSGDIVDNRILFVWGVLLGAERLVLPQKSPLPFENEPVSS